MKDKQKKSGLSEPAVPQGVTKSVTVTVRMRTNVYNPADRTTRTYEPGHVFTKPWKELIERAKADKKHRVLMLIEA